METPKAAKSLKQMMSEIEFPVLNGVLTEELEKGAYFAKQDGKWWLFAKDGEGIATGNQISDLLTNLILIKC